MNFAHVLIIIQFIVLIVLVVMLYFENKKMEKKYKDFMKDD